ncbi:MAG: 2-oxo acid dehydrogenase subunit E2 [Solirubrobacteraceae bacterium]
MTAATTEVRVPDIGDFDGVPVIEILVAVGDTVAAEDPLVTLESDKATMDVPAPSGGVVREIAVSIGDTVSEGAPLMTLEEDADGGNDEDAGGDEGDTGDDDESDGAVEPAPATAAGSAAAGQSQPSARASSDDAEAPQDSEPRDAPDAAQGDGRSALYASPSARRVARELGIDLHSVQGSGRGGRITREDVQSLAQRGPAAAPQAGGALELPPWPKLDFSKLGPVERVPRSRIQRISAPNLARNWAMIPHVTQHDEADITELEAWRKQLNDQHRAEDVKFTMVTFLVAACVATLKAFPEVNASLDGDELIVKGYWNIGFAADTPGGLVVPVIRDADTKGLREIATELAQLSAKARDGKLSPTEIGGASFTISSLGGIGGTSFTPIVNAPEVAILGVSRSAIKPVWNDSEFTPRLMLPLSLSYDHRAIDGALAARFVVHLSGVLSDLRRALL